MDVITSAAKTQSKTHSAIINIKHADNAEEHLSVDTLLTKTAQATTAKSCDARVFLCMSYS